MPKEKKDKLDSVDSPTPKISSTKTKKTAEKKETITDSSASESIQKRTSTKKDSTKKTEADETTIKAKEIAQKAFKDASEKIVEKKKKIKESSAIPSSVENMQEKMPTSTNKKITTDKTYALTDPCPCGSGKKLGECCGIYFDGTHFPETAEELLRSRYTAHVTHHHDYLINTTHSSHREEESEADISKWIDQLEWKGLTVLTSIGGGKNDTKASIFFLVRFLVGGVPREMKETAYFVKENGVWYYTYGDVEGHITYKREQPKLGRNDPCSCGSGKKYKKCCLN